MTPWFLSLPWIALAAATNPDLPNAVPDDASPVVGGRHGLPLGSPRLVEGGALATIELHNLSRLPIHAYEVELVIEALMHQRDAHLRWIAMGNLQLTAREKERPKTLRLPLAGAAALRSDAKATLEVSLGFEDPALVDALHLLGRALTTAPFPEGSFWSDIQPPATLPLDGDLVLPVDGTSSYAASLVVAIEPPGDGAALEENPIAVRGELLPVDRAARRQWQDRGSPLRGVRFAAWPRTEDGDASWLRLEPREDRVLLTGFLPAIDHPEPYVRLDLKFSEPLSGLYRLRLRREL